jgi:probable F420-dependent oxidoreductase
MTRSDEKREWRSDEHMAMSVVPSLPLGLVLPPTTGADVLRHALRLMDESGFDSVWVTDRTLAGIGPWPELWTQLGAVAAMTDRIGIGAVLIPSRRSPVHVAHGLATVDQLSRGRLIAGVGLGGLDPREHSAVGADVRQRARLTDDYIDLVRRLWTEEQVDFEGEHVSLREVGIPIRPTRNIPIWTGGGSTAAIERAARLGDGWLAAERSPEQFAVAVARLGDLAVGHGRGPDDVSPAIFLFGAVAQDRKSAAAKLEPSISAMFGAPLEQLSSACIWGSPSDWRQRIREYQDAGAAKIVVVLFSTDVLADLQLLADEVIPVAPVGATSAGRATASPAYGAAKGYD